LEVKGEVGMLGALQLRARRRPTAVKVVSAASLAVQKELVCLLPNSGAVFGGEQTAAASRL
jgi:hypothetical protein